jgi:hypothetical protein
LELASRPMTVRHLPAANLGDGSDLRAEDQQANGVRILGGRRPEILGKTHPRVYADLIGRSLTHRKRLSDFSAC